MHNAIISVDDCIQLQNDLRLATGNVSKATCLANSIQPFEI